MEFVSIIFYFLLVKFLNSSVNLLNFLFQALDRRKYNIEKDIIYGYTIIHYCHLPLLFNGGWNSNVDDDDQESKFMS